ncbi:MAG: phage holin family protein [Solirubrobacterales bacterium]
MEASGTQSYQANGHDADGQAADQTLGDLVNQISENASTLIREEIELARAEVEFKIRRLAQGAVVAIAAGFFILLGIIFLFEFGAWGINEIVDSIWIGFAAVTVLLFVLAGLAALIAYKSFQAGSPPIPDTAIEEAKLIREALEHPDVEAAMAGKDAPDEPESDDQPGKES